MNRPAKPTLSFWQIWNMCFGFLGIQFGFALQNANASRIFETLGAPMDAVPGLWIAAPLTGLLVQPVIGYWSDRTWTRWGRRRPYFMVGAVLTTLALLVMPNSPTLWIAAGTLWVLDASINVSMEPFRAFVGDQLAPRQRPTGYAMQSFFIGIGAIVASFLPFILAHVGVANTAGAGQVPDTVRYAFYVGAAVLLGAICWTVFSTREYAPSELAGFADAEPPAAQESSRMAGPPPWAQSALWLLIGAGLAVVIASQRGDKMLYVLAGLCAAYGLLLAAIREPDPVIYMEPKRIYRQYKEVVVNDGEALPLDVCFVLRDGTDVTLVTWGAQVKEALEAADKLAGEGISAEVIDVATLRPLDFATIAESVAKTGRCVIVQEAPKTAGFGAEIAARLAEESLYDLLAPVERVTGYDTHIPLFRLEMKYLPSVDRIVSAAKRAIAAG